MAESSVSVGEKAERQATLRDLFSPTFIGVSLINFLGMVAYYAAFVVSQGYLTQTYASSAASAGLSTGIVVIGCLVGRFFIGSVVHRLGYRRILIAGVAFFFLTNVSFLFEAGEVIYFIGRFLSGVAVGMIGTVTGTLVALITPKPFLGRGIAYFSMSTALAVCFGPFLGIALLGLLGFNGIFAVCVGLTATSCVLSLFLKIPAHRKGAAKKGISLSDFIDVRLVPFCMMVGVFCLPWGCTQAFLASYAGEFDVTGAASIFFLVYAAAILLTRPVTGKIYDVNGPDIIFYPAIVSLAAGLALLWSCAGSWAVLAAGALMGFGFGNIQSLGQSTAVAMVPRDRYTQATSTFYIFFDLGIGVAPYLFGLFLAPLGYDGIFGVNALIVLSGIILYWLLRRQRRSRPTSGNAI